MSRKIGPGQYVSYTSTGAVDPVFTIGDLSTDGISDDRRIVPVTAPTEAKLEPDWDTCLATMREKLHWGGLLDRDEPK